MKFDDIAFLKEIKEFTPIEEGYSGAYKYSFYKNERKYFLKVGRFKLQTDLENLLIEAGINHPKIIEMGKMNEEYNYIIEEYSEGDNLKYKLNHYDKKFIYEFGFKIGKQYGNLRKKFPDKHVSKKFLEKHKNDVKNRIKDLETEIENHKKEIQPEQLEFLEFMIRYLEKNFSFIKHSKFVFGHTDVKPSNFLLHKKKIIATDIEHTDYKELSLALLWSYARGDYKNEKNIAFTQGYLDGLYNLNIPKNILYAFNYNYIYNMVNYCTDYLKEQNYKKMTRLITYVKEHYMKNGTIIISEKLRSNSNVKNFPKLKKFDFALVEGSYSPDNFKFECTNKKKHYFLKIITMSEKRFERILKYYKLLEEEKIPMSPVRDYGVCEKDKCYYVVFDFIPYKEMNAEKELTTFEEGKKYGLLVAKYLKRLKGKTLAEMSILDDKKLYSDILDHVNKVYQYDNYSQYVKWSKEETIKYIDTYIKEFQEEPLNLIHRDIKFGNILYDKGENLIFVDNETITYSYDILNFLYNIHDGFRPNANKAYHGFVNGYLSYMNQGVIPKRIEGQAKLLLLYYYFRIVLAFLEKRGKETEIEEYMNLCEEYIVKGKTVEWLN